MNYSKWKDEEVIKFFKFIEKGRQSNIPLSNLFSKYASESNRMPNSVRNYYYAELKNLEKDKKRCESFGIDMSVHVKCEQKAFNKDEVSNIMTSINNLKKQGISIRKACYQLAQGNISLMVRYQNKYRTLMSVKKNQIVQKEKNAEAANNVIKMPTKRMGLGDGEINSLFLGLVKLVKKQAMEDAGLVYKKESEQANESLRKTLIELTKKELELKELRTQFKILMAEKGKLKNEVEELRGKNAEFLSSVGSAAKLKKFKKYAERLEKNQTAT